MKISILTDEIISYLENPNNHLKMSKQNKHTKTIKQHQQKAFEPMRCFVVGRDRDQGTRVSGTALHSNEQPENESRKNTSFVCLKIPLCVGLHASICTTYVQEPMEASRGHWMSWN